MIPTKSHAGLSWRPRPLDVLGIGVGLIAGALLLGSVFWWAANGFYAGDTLTYWLAGQRVLVGHEIYRIQPDDPWLFDIRPFGLYSPPLVVVPWLVLAGLPGTAGMIVWWVSMAFAALWAIAVVLIGTRGWAGLLVIPLVPSITLLIGVGNVDTLVLAGIVATRLLIARGSDRSAGVLVGILASLKLTPAVLVVWLIATRRWRALAGAATAVAACAFVVGLALGPAVFLDYARVMVGGVAGGRSGSLYLATGLLVIVFVLGRRFERLGFALAIAAIPLGSPVAAGHTWALLVGALAPWIGWRRASGAAEEPAEDQVGRAGQGTAAPDLVQTTPSASA